MRRLGAIAFVCALAFTLVGSPASRAAAAGRDLDSRGLVFQRLTLTPSSPFTGDTLHADALASEPDFSASVAGKPVTYTYEWSRNGVVLVGETGPTLDLSTAGNGDSGDTISVRVTASEGELTADASTSVVVADSLPTATESVADTAPATNAVVPRRAMAGDHDNQGNTDRADGVVGEPVASAEATVNSAPTVSVSLNTTMPLTRSVVVATVLGQDIDNDGLTYVYTWRLDGVVKRTITTTATTDRYDLSIRGNGDEGDVVTVTVTASDGSLTSPSASVSATIRSR
jgi:hypothetical protein